MELYLSVINKLLSHDHLSQNEIQQIFSLIFDGKLNQVSVSAILTALKIRGERTEDLKGIIDEALLRMKPFPNVHCDFIDIVGTGGDLSHSFNISTTTSFVMASLGFPVIKHGNKAVSSICGSSDVLAKSGLDLFESSEKSFDRFLRHKLCFLHAPQYHGSFKSVAEIRKNLGFKTIFNLIGPLLNPAMPKKMLIGVSEERLLTTYGQILKERNVDHALVVFGGGLDEVALHTESKVVEVHKNHIVEKTLCPKDFDLPFYELSEIKGGTAEENFLIMLNIFKGIATFAQQAAIAVNGSLAMTLFGQSDLKKNAHTILTHLKSGECYKYFENFVGKQTNV